jgi:hypothetical protein
MGPEALVSLVRHRRTGTILSPFFLKMLVTRFMLFAVVVAREVMVLRM